MSKIKKIIILGTALIVGLVIYIGYICSGISDFILAQRHR